MILESFQDALQLLTNTLLPSHWQLTRTWDNGTTQCYIFLRPYYQPIGICIDQTQDGESIPIFFLKACFGFSRDLIFHLILPKWAVKQLCFFPNACFFQHLVLLTSFQLFYFSYFFIKKNSFILFIFPPKYDVRFQDSAYQRKSCVTGDCNHIVNTAWSCSVMMIVDSYFKC